MLVSTLQQVFEHFVHLFVGEITGSSDLLAHLSIFYPSKVFPINNKLYQLGFISIATYLQYSPLILFC